MQNARGMTMKKKNFWARIKPLEWILIAVTLVIIITIIILNVGGGVHVQQVNNNLAIYFRQLFAFGAPIGTVHDIVGGTIHTQNFITYLFVAFLYVNLFMAVLLIIFVASKKAWRTLLGVLPFILGAGLTLYSGTFFFIGIQPVLNLNESYFSMYPYLTFTNCFSVGTWMCICFVGTLTLIVYLTSVLSLVLTITTAIKEAKARKEKAKVKELPVPMVVEKAVAPVIIEKTVSPIVVEKIIKVKKVYVAPRIPFAEKLENSDKDIKDKYNQIKSHLLAYGVKSRVSIPGDTFRLHKEDYAIVTIVGKHLKIYLPLNVKDFKNTIMPVIDASHFKKYKDLPLAFNIKSDLSFRRALRLIDDAMTKKGLKLGEEIAKNHALAVIRKHSHI